MSARGPQSQPQQARGAPRPPPPSQSLLWASHPVQGAPSSIASGSSPHHVQWRDPPLHVRVNRPSTSASATPPHPHQPPLHVRVNMADDSSCLCRADSGPNVALSVINGVFSQQLEVVIAVTAIYRCSSCDPARLGGSPTVTASVHTDPGLEPDTPARVKRPLASCSTPSREQLVL